MRPNSTHSPTSTVELKNTKIKHSTKVFALCSALVDTYILMYFASHRTRRSRNFRHITAFIDQKGPAELHDHCSVLFESSTSDLHQSHMRPGFRFALADHRRLCVDRIPFEDRRG